LRNDYYNNKPDGNQRMSASVDIHVGQETKKDFVRCVVFLKTDVANGIFSFQANPKYEIGSNRGRCCQAVYLIASNSRRGPRPISSKGCMTAQANDAPKGPTQHRSRQRFGRDK